MKILFDIREQTRNITGIGTYVKNLAREIRDLDRPDLQCRCLPENPAPPPLDGVRPLPLQLVNFVRNLCWKQFYLPVRAWYEGADVLVCLDPLGPLVSPVPTALIIYDLIFMTSAAQTDAWTRYWRFMVPLCARRSDLILTLSEAARASIIELLRIPEEKVLVFHTGVARHFRPLDLTPERAAEKRRELGLPESFILSVGAHDPRRNIPTLLKAYERVRSRVAIPHKVVVVGPKTPFFKEVWQTTLELGLEEDVLYLDYVPNEELPLYYGLADLYLYPSSEEGFGLTPLEAMACRCPVITSSTSSLPEVVGEAAIKVNPTEAEELARAMEAVLSDRAMREDLIRKGIKRAGMFSWRAGAEDIVNAGLRLVGRA